MAYGKSPEEAMAKTQALALRVITDRIEHGEELLGNSLRGGCLWIEMK